MAAYIRSVTVAAISLILLLLFTTRLVRERAELRQALLRTEKYVVALALLTAPAGSFRGDETEPKHKPDWTIKEIENFAQALRETSKFNRADEIISTGQRAARYEWPSHLYVGASGIGVVYFTTQAEPHFDVTRLRNVITRGLEECAPERRSDTLERVFFLTIRVHSRQMRGGDILGPSFDLYFTNAYTPLECLIAGPSRVVVNVDSYTPQLLGRSELRARIVRLARSAGATTDDPSRAYFELRSRYERERVNVPVIGGEMSRTEALTIAVALALALLTWLSSLLRRLAYTEIDSDEPWLAIEPLRAMATVPRWEKPIVGLEFILFTAFHITAILASPWLGFVAIKERANTNPESAGAWILFVISVFVAANALRRYGFIVRRFWWRSREAG